MNKHTLVLWFFGGLSLLTGVMALLSSSITYHPNILQSAHRFINVLVCIWAVSLLTTVVLSLTAVPFASGDDLPAARLIRRQGLWLVIPQIAVSVILTFAGLMVARR